MMNGPPDMEPLERQPAATTDPTNWREAVLVMVASRVALIGIESKEAAIHATRRAILIGMAGFCAFFMWALLLAGGIAALADASGWPWYGFAVAIGLFHLAAALLFGRAARTPVPPPFPITCAEFKKDREWIETLQTTPKSGV